MTFPFEINDTQYSVRHGRKVLHKTGSLYDAACWMCEYVGSLYVTLPPANLVAVDTETSERWTYVELYDGHFMDDALPLESLSGVVAKNVEDPAAAWMGSSLVKRKYRRPLPQRDSQHE